jgi:hypothetical protein
MAHYALLDEDNIVVEVFVGEDESNLIEGKNPEEYYSEEYGKRCLRTSYNGNIRGNYANPGMKYDQELDMFLTNKPYASWTLNLETGKWEAPLPEPVEWQPLPYFWNEDTFKWEIEPYYKNSITIESRVLICLECPFWVPENTTCSKCSCPGKTLHTNPHATCPDQRW